MMKSQPMSLANILWNTCSLRTRRDGMHDQPD